MSSRDHSEKPKFQSALCVSCAQKCWILPSYAPFCNSCFFRDFVLSPIVAALAPTAEIRRVDATGNYAVQIGAKVGVVSCPGWWIPQEEIQGRTAATYETVRRLVEPGWVFDWRTICQ